ncbi:hypothetical protein [Nocardioides sp.]|uniref:hypothetical protein n=1 Tax=Nocardioides sp. TaxID=35761 RepID=UPI002BCB74C7|nr:hypothetical protein [Nocardioides sp.]HSX65932.1 hypothetical protein [Nocardioides sp.]
MNANSATPSGENENAAKVWNLISTVLEIPENAGHPRDYWDDVMQGTCLLLGIILKLAREADRHGQDSRPALTAFLIRQVLQHEDEIEKAWLQAISC